MTAICGDCGAEVSWRARRGARLADLNCPNGHAGVLNAAAWDAGEARYVIRGGTSKSRGQHYGQCALSWCGRRRLTRRLRILPVDLRPVWRHDERIYPAGSTICWHHEISRECGPYGCLECVRAEAQSA